MKKIFLLVLLGFGIFSANAQQFTCGTDEHDAYLRKTNPKYASECQKMEQQIYSILRNKQNNPNARMGTNTCQQPDRVITLPIVVHIIHKGEAVGTGTNISDAQVINAVKSMNDMWRGVTGDGVDMEIQFELAVRDTNNNATNGIIRHDGRVFPNYVSNGILYGGNPIGASEHAVIINTAWDRSKYFNIWVADIGGTGGGWASLGNNSTFFVSHYLSSSTLAHEMGHAFGLHHTFAGDGSGSGSGPSTQCPPNDDCLLDGDWVCDTPPHKKSECNSTSCAGSGDLQNSFGNYMSYCSSRARFTQGQKERARVFLFNIYNEYILSDALIPINTPLEAGIQSIENDLSQPMCIDNFIPKIKIHNSGLNTISTLKIATYIDDELYDTKTITTNLLKNTSATYNLNAINFNKHGQKNIRLVIKEINGSINDYRSLDNQICTEVWVKNHPESNICIDFEDDNIDTLLFKHNYSLSNISGCSTTGSKSLKYKISESIDKGWEYFYLPSINLDSNPAYSVHLTFDRAYKQGPENTQLYLSFNVINGCDSTTKGTEYNKKNEELVSVTGRDSLSIWKPTKCTDWARDSVSLKNYLGQKNISIRGAMHSYGNINTQPLYLDNFCILKRYRVNTELNNYNAGFVFTSINDGIYEEGNIATITAKAFGNCYKFSNWMENGVVVSEEAEYTFVVDRNRNLVANYVNLADHEILPNSFCLNFEDSNIDTILFEHNYFERNYFLSDVSGCAMNGSKAIKYKFEDTDRSMFYLPSIDLDSVFSAYLTFDRAYKRGSENTQLELNLYAIEGCGGAGSWPCCHKRDEELASVPERDSITIWEPTDCTHWNKDTFNLARSIGKKNILLRGIVFHYGAKGNQSLYLDNFCLLKRYQINTVIRSGNGYISHSGTEYPNVYDEGSIAIITAIPHTGYVFDNWMENNAVISSDSVLAFTVTANRNIQANFSLRTSIKTSTITAIDKIYPNPTSNTLNVEIYAKKGSAVTFNIIDAQGRLMTSKTIKTVKGNIRETFDVSNLAKGNYILMLYDEDGAVSHQFIVQ